MLNGIIFLRAPLAPEWRASSSPRNVAPRNRSLLRTSRSSHVVRHDDFRNLWHRKVRTGLTCLGMAVAVCAVVTMIGVADVFEQAVGKLLETRGVDLVVTRAGVAQRIASTSEYRPEVSIRAASRGEERGADARGRRLVPGQQPRRGIRHGLGHSWPHVRRAAFQERSQAQTRRHAARSSWVRSSPRPSARRSATRSRSRANNSRLSGSIRASICLRIAWPSSRSATCNSSWIVQNQVTAFMIVVEDSPKKKEQDRRTRQGDRRPSR